MSALAEEKIIHGDLRCANILICQLDPRQPQNTLVKLTNFHQAFQKGAANFTNRPVTNLLEHYGAIELLSDTSPSTYSEYSESYSMGILMWQMYSHGDLPFGSASNSPTVRIRRLNGEKLAQPNGCRNDIWAIISSCFYQEPALRSKFEEIRKQLNPIRSRAR